MAFSHHERLSAADATPPVDLGIADGEGFDCDALPGRVDALQTEFEALRSAEPAASSSRER